MSNEQAKKQVEEPTEDNFACDFTSLFTVKDLATELHIQFTGCGWYLGEEDTMLILNSSNPLYPYMVMVWNRPNVREMFKSIYEMPTRRS